MVEARGRKPQGGPAAAAEVELNSPDGQPWPPLGLIFAVAVLIGATAGAMHSLWLFPDVAAFVEGLAGEDPMPFLKVFFGALCVVFGLLILKHGPVPREPPN